MPSIVFLLALACGGGKAPPAAPEGGEARTDASPDAPPVAPADGMPVVMPVLSHPPGEPPPPEATACTADADCVISCARPNDCCDQLCACSNAVNQSWLATHEAWKGEKCSETVCPIASCAPPAFTITASCEEGRCKSNASPRKPPIPPLPDKPIPPG